MLLSTIKPIFLTLIVVIFSAFAAMSQSNSLPEGFTKEALDTPVDAPVGFDFDDRGNLFIWDKHGVVSFARMSDDYSELIPFLDISDEVGNWGDHGLMDVAFDPDFSESGGWMYLYYVVDRYYMEKFGSADYDPSISQTSQATIGRISRYWMSFQDGVPVCDESSRQIILGQSYADGLAILMLSHGVGSLVFGQDKSLLISFGDGGSFTESDLGNANDTYHEQAILDGALTTDQNIGAFRSMMRNSPHGKILRINKDTGEGVASNPYYESNAPRSHMSRVWCMGFRNPFKMIKYGDGGSHDISAGDPGTFLVGDVGSSNWEELNVIKESGQWYGWPLLEGYDGKYDFFSADVRNPETSISDKCLDGMLFKDQYSEERLDLDYSRLKDCAGDALSPEKRYIHTPPILAYSNDKWNPPAKTRVRSFDGSGVSSSSSIRESSALVNGDIISGGSILPGGVNEFDLFPDDYIGKLFIGDFHGYIYALDLDNELKVKTTELFYDDQTDGMTDLNFNPVDGSLYFTDIVQKKLFRIGFGGMLPPIVRYRISSPYGNSPLRVTLDASNSISRTNTELSYSWSFPDGSTSDQTVAEYLFISNGIENQFATLTVTDEFGLSDSISIPISLNNSPPIVQIDLPNSPNTYSTDSYNVIELKANVSDAEHDQEDLEYAWRVDLYHDDHFHEGPVDRTVQSLAILDALGCGLESYHYKIVLDVTDPLGLVGHDEYDIFPFCGERIADIFDFSAAVDDQQIRLDWTVLSANDLIYFQIEKTDNYLFRDFEIVDYSTQLKDYTLLDDNPFIGPNYYRIRAYNEEGDYSLSDVVSVVFDGPSDIQLWPNRVNDILYVRAQAVQQHLPILYEISDMVGRVLDRALLVDCTPGESCRPEINVSDLASGYYFIRFDIGETRLTRRFLKQ